MGTTEAIARFVVETAYSAVPDDVIRLAREAVLDCIGVSLAGSTEPASRIIAEHVGATGGTPQAGIFGGGPRTSAPQAALANGTMAHALDYDDVLAPMSGHPSVPVLPAVLALGEAHHRGGRETLLAYIIGVEVEARVGAGIGRRHYAVGWHPTSTLGTLGAAAASAKLLGLGVAETRLALGIAASEAAGLRQNFGTMTKPFHAGNAARAGVVAAMLAAGGFTANDSILESEFGFAPVLGGDGEYDLAMMTANLGRPFAIADPGLDMKPYPCCRFIHRCLDAILGIAGEHHPESGQIEAVECHTSPFVPRVVIHHRPKTPLEGKFSMEYCMARALLDGDVRVAQFSAEKVLDPVAQELLGRVSYVHPEGAGSPGAPEKVTVRMRDGREFSREVLHATGSPENPMPLEELAGKYRDCAGVVLSDAAVERSLEMILHLDEVADVADLAELVTSPAGVAPAG